MIDLEDKFKEFIKNIEIDKLRNNKNLIKDWLKEHNYPATLDNILTCSGAIISYLKEKGFFDQLKGIFGGF